MGLLVPREGCPYVGQAPEAHPEFREQAARLVIETGRPVAHVAAEIGVGEEVLGVGCASIAEPFWLVRLARRQMLMNVQNLSVCAVKTLNYVRTVSF